MKANKITETQESVSSDMQQTALEAIQNEYDTLEFEFGRVKEQLYGLDLMLDNRGWSEVFGMGNQIDGGPSLQQLRYAGMELRALTAQNAHLKRGNLLRCNYVWSGGIHYSGVTTEGRGKGTNVQKLIDLPQNQREFFGASARKKRSKALYTDGHMVYIGNDTDKTLKTLDFHKVTGTITNPEDITEIWAILVEIAINQNDNASKLESRWIYLDGFTDKRKSGSIQGNGVQGTVDMDRRAFLRVTNPTIGWTWGTPDALAAMAWVRQYREFLLSGKKMSDAMAMLWAQVKSETKNGAVNAAAQFNSTGAGGTAFGGAEVAPLATAGKGYDFDSGRALLAAAATSLEVSVIDLSSDPGAAGSSYGSAQTLNLPGRMAIAGIREDEAEFDMQILRWMGAKDPLAWFDSLLAPEDIYRMVQTEMMFWESGTRTAQEQKAAMDNAKGRPKSDPVPDGVMLPNNEKYTGTLTNDNQPAATTPAGAPAVPKQAAAPGQGKNAPGGKGPGSNGLRTDKVSK
jgi:hypothetical protein